MIQFQSEVNEEYYLYGLPNFVSDMGGTMGLFLGASLLSITNFLIDILVTIIRSATKYI